MIRYNVEKQAHEIALINIFRAVQGEGPEQNFKTVFIRTMYCNARCPWCFAPDQSGHYPYVMDAYGRLLNMADVRVGDRIMTLNPENNEPYVTTVTNVLKRDVDPQSIRKVSLGKTSRDNFNVTDEHPFYTTRGWQAIKDINIGDYVKRTPNAALVRYLVEKLYRAELVKYTKAAVDTYVNNHQDHNNFNSKNGMYKEAFDARNFTYAKNGLQEMDHTNYPFAEVWGTKNLMVHHVDKNSHNDDLNNLVVIPKKLHDQLHARGNNFNKGHDETLIEVTANHRRRTNKRFGSTVINIETEAHSYYVKSSLVGNNILVHNCDTRESWTLEKLLQLYPERGTLENAVKWYTAEEIFNEVEIIEKDWPQKSVCLTGGEPLMPENETFMIKELIPLFVKALYSIDIETNGTIDYEPYKEAFGDAYNQDITGHRCGVYLAMDWKMPASNMTSKMLESNLKILSGSDLIKVVMTDDPRDWTELERLITLKSKAPIYISPCFNNVTMHRIPEFIQGHPEANLRAQIQTHKIFYDFNQKDV